MLKYYTKEIIGFYAGIGSRKTPKKYLDKMYQFGVDLAEMGYCLRSGGAIGADIAFENGCNSVNGNKEIYYPSDSNSHLINFVKDYHPKFDSLSDYAKRLHARNVLQVFGYDIENPIDFIICYTPDGYGTNNYERTIKSGGTATAVQIALDYNIPVFNLKNICTEKVVKEIKKIMKEKNVKL